MWRKWFPWRYLIRRLARSHGFIDPIVLLSRLQAFAQPSEVSEPIELLRAGVIFHARGLLNTKAIQHNLDWVWPYWVERQFDPTDPAFIPRAFSITHVNLTHRNWTAVGLPDLDAFPLVDPRGLVTPLHDAWSVDTWVVDEDAGPLFPSKLLALEQELRLDRDLEVVTRAARGGVRLETTVDAAMEDGLPICRVRATATAPAGGWVVFSLRPYNPEGVSFVHELELDPDRRSWLVDGEHRLRFDEPVDKHESSDYRSGDVRLKLGKQDDVTRHECEIGMVTAAGMYRLEPGAPRKIGLTISLPTIDDEGRLSTPVEWSGLLDRVPELRLGDEHLEFLYRAAARTLLLLSPREVYPGPYTYRRFWFRDCAFLLDALLALGYTERARRQVEAFPDRQTRGGYFLSQDGEWDSNGEALWILRRFAERTASPLPREWEESARRGAEWILRKRLPEDSGAPHAGLLPAGFSAEHLGTNDYYYWDDYWSVAGLEAAAAMLGPGDPQAGRRYTTGAAELRRAIDRSIEAAAEERDRPGIPASPYRRMDSGAVGSLAAGYPLQLYPPRDARVLDTAEFLLENCFVEGGFFQDMIHSGINPYLTLHVAQVLLRAGDPRALTLIRRVGELASPTGQWPEAIHPRTLGGCMGDGQHGWAAAEWVLALRALFVREEEDGLVLGAGFTADLLAPGEVRFGPTLTRWGPVTVGAERSGGGVTVRWEGEWFAAAPPVRVALPGKDAVEAPAGAELLEVPGSPP